jgi:putative transposase
LYLGATRRLATPRKPRFAPAGCCVHVTNRGNDRRRLFFEDVDYWTFVRLLTRAKRRYPVKVYGLCVMPNHFHALVEPLAEGAVSAYLQWALGRYACDLRQLTNTTGEGHVFQSRFWSDVIDDDRHFLSVLRYIEANPVKAQLVGTASEWPWSSLRLRGSTSDTLLDELPVDLPSRWHSLVDIEQPAEDVDRIERPQARGRPPAALDDPADG